MYIAIDFDGTCVTHEFPKIGKDINAVPVLKKLAEQGHNLILNTMRSDIKNPVSGDDEIHCESGMYLTDAVNWFRENDIPLFGIQTNPTQRTWTSSPKVYANLYIDDCALGCPLKFDETISKNPFVDWDAVCQMLLSAGILTEQTQKPKPCNNTSQLHRKQHLRALQSDTGNLQKLFTRIRGAMQMIFRN